MRDVEEAAEKGHERAKLALEMYAYRVKKYIGAYTAAMGGVDLIIFTGGIGENDFDTRSRSMEGLGFMGIDFDFEKNKGLGSHETVLTHPGSKVTVMIMPTNEELVIAMDTHSIVTDQK
jgi:acetate kinase